MLKRIDLLEEDLSNAPPSEVAGLDGEICVIEYAHGTNVYFRTEVWSPQVPLSEDLRASFQYLYPDREVDFDKVNGFLRRVCNLANWFAERTKIKELDIYQSQ